MATYLTWNLKYGPIICMFVIVHDMAYTGCFIICVTIKNCYGFFENAKIYQRLTQPCSRHCKVLFNV